VNFLYNLKTSSKLLVSFFLMAALASLVGAVGLFHLHKVNQTLERINGQAVPALSNIKEANSELIKAGRAMRNLIIYNTPAEGVEGHIKDMEERMKGLDDFYALTLKDLDRSNPKSSAAIASIERDLPKLRQAQAEVLALVKAGKIDEAKIKRGEVREYEGGVDDALSAIDEACAESMRSMGQQSASDYAAARWMITLTIVLAVVLAGLVGIVLARLLGGALTQAAEVAQAVADGDLSRRVERVERQDESGQLMRALAAMSENLSRIVSDVRQGAEGVATASTEIANGNHDLSRRTEEQASALEETAAAMEELGSTVRQNSDNAQQANQLALNASQVAIKGGEVVNQVVATMRGIDEASKRIHDIIGVIDGIAFQTNILALNAAVEAARAGEQGRGFAVVANEVRSLAGRSADAAKEIKRLISTSVERVEQGTALVDQAGNTMSEVVGAIRRVTDIMGEISAASIEQNTGVSQVGEAVIQMDRNTQQNAALVEESAAAAESLKLQAAQLVSAVAIFKL